jgi:hypothetical protein
MSIQPIDLPSLLHALIWPFIVIAALAVFRRPLGDLVSVLGQRVHKLSVAGYSLELAQVREMQPRAMDTEIRQLDAGLIPQSGSTSLTALVTELQSGGQHDYLLSFLVTLIRRQLCLVFVETAGGLRKRFVGTASPEQARWALARRYGWLESAGASAYAMQAGNPPIGFLPSPTPSNQFDPATGYLSTIIPNLIQQFLGFVRSPQAPPENSAEKSEWVTLDGQQFEHAKWLDGARIERLLGSDLATSYATLPPNKTLNDLADIIISQQGRFVAIVEPDKAFRGIVDRSAALEHVATEFSRQTAQASPRNS